MKLLQAVLSPSVPGVPVVVVQMVVAMRVVLAVFSWVDNLNVNCCCWNLDNWATCTGWLPEGAA